jgi:hypothetical protein
VGPATRRPRAVLLFLRRPLPEQGLLAGSGFIIRAAVHPSVRLDRVLHAPNFSAYKLNHLSGNEEYQIKDDEMEVREEGEGMWHHEG